MSERRPWPLTIAAALAGAEALVFLIWTVLVLVNVSTMSVTSAIFFLIYAAALAACCYGILRLNSWARSPVVLTQLIMLGLAWDARHAALGVVLPLALVALAVLACMFSPGSIAALSPDDRPHGFPGD